MKYIITGGAGFIGSHLVEALVKQNKKIVVLDNLSTGRLDNIKPFLKKIKFINCDISKKGKWINEFNEKCYVFHIAALADIVPSMQNPEKYFNSNVKGTLNVLEACKKTKVIKFLYSASSSCYGVPKKYPTKENENIDLMYPYALTKKLGEDLIIHWSKVYKIPFVSLRLFNVYGTRSRTSGTYGAMFGVFLAQKIANKPFTVVGTDLSGVAQTEVITGPVANATVLGSKTFKTISSITPSANTTGNITLGFTGVGITTTGVTGSATLDGVAMSADVANNIFTISSGLAAGLKVKYSGLGADGSVYYGDSLLDKLTSYISTALTSTKDGSVASRIISLNKEITSESTLLTNLNTKFESTRARYLSQFTAMEQAVTSLKSTGEYLTNLFEAMNKD